LGLLLHLFHEPWPLDDVGEAGIVLYIGGDGELPAGLDALDEHRLQHGAGGIDRGGVAGGTRTDDEELGAVHLDHPTRPRAGREATPAGNSRGRPCWAVRAQIFTGAPRGPPAVAGGGSPASASGGTDRNDALHNLWLRGSYARYADQEPQACERQMA